MSETLKHRTALPSYCYVIISSKQTMYTDKSIKAVKHAHNIIKHSVTTTSANILKPYQAFLYSVVVQASNAQMHYFAHRFC